MRPVDSVITKLVDETPSTRTIFFDTTFQPRPGQFVMVWIHGVDEVPMALSYNNAITVQKVGEATSALFEMEECDSIGIRGPFGNGFDINGKSKNILLISGGVGAAPLAPLAEQAAASGINVTTMLGALTKDELLFVKRFGETGDVLVATDDGSAGMKGYVTGLLDDVDAGKFDMIYCCGPEPMMKKVLDRVPPEKTQFSLHRYFKCGIGVCGACCIDGLRVCKDGPVFRGDVLKETEFGKFKRDGCGCKVKV